MAAFTDAQFQQFMEMMRGNNPPPPGTAAPPAPVAAPRNDPAALGPMPPCSLGTNKMSKLTKFEEWLEEAENRMAYIGNQSDQDKIILLKSWGGAELNEFMKSHVTIITTLQPAVGDQPAVAADTYAEVVEKIKVELRNLVNRTMALHDLFNSKQGSKTWMTFVHELEKKAKVLDFARRPYTTEEAVKDAAIRGMRDVKLSERALAEDLDKDTLVKQGQAREAGKQDVSHLREKDSTTVRKVSCRKDIEEMCDEDLETIIQAVNIMKLQKAGKYSNRHKDNKKDNITEDGSCGRCLTKHPRGRCPAWGTVCNNCKGKNHYEHACKKGQSSEIRRVMETYLSSRSSDGPEVEECQEATIRKMSLKVPISVGKSEPMSMFIDSGVKFTVIPPEKYSESMGMVEESDMNFRSWGAKNILKTHGMISTTLRTNRGAMKKTKVYIVEGFSAEPLLGYEDAEELGFITICRDGRAATTSETEGCVIQTVNLVVEREEEQAS